jgi:hypothetical protein
MLAQEQIEECSTRQRPICRPGIACIFDRCTYHRSLKYETGEHRYAYAAQYQVDNARIASTGKKDPLRMRARDLPNTLRTAAEPSPG